MLFWLRYYPIYVFPNVSITSSRFSFMSIPIFFFFCDLYVCTHQGVFLSHSYYQIPKMYLQITKHIINYLLVHMQCLVVINTPSYGAFFYIYYFVGYTAIIGFSHVSLFLECLCVNILPLYCRLNVNVYGRQDSQIQNFLTHYIYNIGLIFWVYVTHDI